MEPKPGAALLDAKGMQSRVEAQVWVGLLTAGTRPEPAQARAARFAGLDMRMHNHLEDASTPFIAAMSTTT